MFGLLSARGNIIVKQVYWTLGNKLHWNLNQNLNIFIQENAFENVVWNMVAILSQPQCVTIFSTYGQGHSSISSYFFQPACHWLHFNVYPYDMRSPQTHTIAIAIICDQMGSMRIAPWGNSSYRLDGWIIGFDWRQTLGRAFIWSVWNKPTWPISAWKVCLIYCRWHVASDIANAFSWNEKRIFFCLLIN